MNAFLVYISSRCVGVNWDTVTVGWNVFMEETLQNINLTKSTHASTVKSHRQHSHNLLPEQSEVSAQQVHSGSGGSR